jgi:hypothetical protein
MRLGTLSGMIVVRLPSVLMFWVRMKMALCPVVLEEEETKSYWMVMTLVYLSDAY